MREALGPYRASLTQGRRRSIIFLFVLAAGIFGAISWSSFRPLQVQRDFLHKLEAGNLTPENFFEFTPGVSCFGPEPAPDGIGPGGPKPPGETPLGETPSGEPTPSEAPTTFAPTCQFVGPNGEPIGEPFNGDPYSKFRAGEVSQAEVDALKPIFVNAARDHVALLEKELAPRELFQSRVRALGTFLGILFTVLFASTFLGGEMRWGVWRTLLTHEPRRGKLLASKFAALLTFVLVGLAVTLLVSTGVDVVMRNVLNVRAVGGPAMAALAKQTGWAALSLGTYATIAAALTVSVRTSLAGAASLLILLGDHLLVQKFIWLRVYLPSQQVAWLLPMPKGNTSGYAWPPQIIAKFECNRPVADTVAACKEIMLKPIPHWRGSLVLGAWLIGFALAAWAVFRARDIPQ